MHCLTHDEVDFDELPPWARAKPFRVFATKPHPIALFDKGLRLRSGPKGRYSAVPWEEVLTYVPLTKRSRLLIASARRPPRLPWFEVRGRPVSALRALLQERLSAVRQGDYRRSGGRSRTRVDPDELLAQAVAHEPIAGAVEIGAPPRLPASIGWSAAGAGGLALGAYVLKLGLASPLVLIGGVVGATIGSSVAHLVGTIRPRDRRTRVLILTPDVFIGGLGGDGVQAVPWERVGRFVQGTDDRGNPALEVYDTAQACLAHVPGHFFTLEVEVIVAVAEAYRRRASAL